MTKSVMYRIKENNKKYKRAIMFINTISYILGIAIIIAFETGAARMCSEITNDNYFFAMIALVVLGAMVEVGALYCSFIYPVVHKYKTIIEKNNTRLDEMIRVRNMKLRQLEEEFK